MLGAQSKTLGTFDSNESIVASNVFVRIQWQNDVKKTWHILICRHQSKCNIVYLSFFIKKQDNPKRGIAKFHKVFSRLFCSSNRLFIDICYSYDTNFHKRFVPLSVKRQVLLWWRANLKWFCQTVRWGKHQGSETSTKLTGNECKWWVPFRAIELLEKKSLYKMIFGCCWPGNDWFPKIDKSMYKMSQNLWCLLVP